MPQPPTTTLSLTAEAAIADVTELSEASASLERILNRWVGEFEEVHTPDIPTLCEAIDFLTRLTAVRKTLIKLSLPSATPLPPTGNVKFVVPPSGGTNPTSATPDSDSADCLRVGVGVPVRSSNFSLPGHPAPATPHSDSAHCGIHRRYDQRQRSTPGQLHGQ
jgi:hypothetical protein